MKELLEKMIVDSINDWTDEDIYAASLFVYNESDNPSKPTVTLECQPRIKRTVV